MSSYMLGHTGIQVDFPAGDPGGGSFSGRLRGAPSLAAAMQTI